MIRHFTFGSVGRVAAAVGCLLGALAVAADDQPAGAGVTDAPVAVKAQGDVAPVRGFVVVGAASQESAPPTPTPTPTTFNFVKDGVVLAYTDAQAPGAALLQANDAHRKAFTEMVQCKNCHGGGGDQRGEIAKWMGVMAHRDGVKNDLELQLLDAQEMQKRIEADSGPKLGVTVGPVDDVLRAQLGLQAGKGLVVTEVLPESPAQRSGVEAHDVMVSAGDALVATEEDLAHTLRSVKADNPPLRFRLIRKGQPVEVLVAPQFPAKKAVVALDAPLAEATQPHYRIGVQIAQADDTLRDQLSLADTGVVVLEVLPKTPAERDGLRAYDVITRAGGRPVRNERDLSEAVQAAKDSKVELEYVRAAKRQYVTVAPEVAPAQPAAAAADPTAATHALARELFLLSPNGNGADGGRMVVTTPQRWEVVDVAKAGNGADSTAQQLEQINAEIQKLRAEIEVLNARIAAENQENHGKGEKK